MIDCERKREDRRESTANARAPGTTEQEKNYKLYLSSDSRKTQHAAEAESKVVAEHEHHKTTEHPHHVVPEHPEHEHMHHVAPHHPAPEHPRQVSPKHPHHMSREKSGQWLLNVTREIDDSRKTHAHAAEAEIKVVAEHEHHKASEHPRHVAPKHHEHEHPHHVAPHHPVPEHSRHVLPKHPHHVSREQSGQWSLDVTREIE
ncbi:hypothetical protein TELCIR_04384 [Teladorsagia circumcincta]|uniref:Uncharacterized protein n=1 Tax=Teladorsagia circumcincta TaxID=45464 RepID=A0A2G9UTS7_TELCI|nr:hypothetical protein TELCIR_04384 [Teladorsagia circumcincta]